MPTELRHLLDTDAPYPVARLIGVLDTTTAHTARSVLLDGLARDPEALLIDVFAVRVSDPAAVAVFGDVARDTADWPAAHLVICAPGGDGLWQASGLPVWPNHAEAIAALGEPDPTHQTSLTLAPVLGAARRSRELVTEACARWDRPDLVGPASIVVTELVNNVVAHARTTMTIRLALRGDEMALAVQDGSTAVPRFTGPVAPTSYGGRGLLLIDSMSQRWGSLTLDDGKVIWAILHGDGEVDHAARADRPEVVDVPQGPPGMAARRGG